MTPKIIHIIYFPWDENHRLKADEFDFDQTPIELLRQYAPDFEVKLWTYSRARDFCQQHYPNVWKKIEHSSHPVMLVDILRWVVVHHFGGIYWQMNAVPLQPMDNLLPSAGKQVRLFTEFLNSPEFCQSMAKEPIRAGVPEESTRILIQAFSALPQANFLEKTIGFLVDRFEHHIPQKDYDILYITGNAAISTAYDQFGRQDSRVELIDLATSRRMLKWRYEGAWRKDSPRTKKEEAPTFEPTRLDLVPLLAATAYRWLKTHPHELMLAEQNTTKSRKSCLADTMSFISEHHIRTVCEAPCGIVENIPDHIHYVGATPNRSAISEYKTHAPHNARFHYANMLYTRFPRVDLFICPDFLESLPYRECLRVLRRILRTARPRYLALTSYRFLNDAWDTALGDFRPIAYHLSPFSFPDPITTFSLSHHTNSRSDRYLQLFQF